MLGCHFGMMMQSNVKVRALYVQMSLIMLWVPVWQNDAFWRREKILQEQKHLKNSLRSFWDQNMFLSNFNLVSALILPSIIVFLLIYCFMSTSDFSDVSMLSDPTTLPFDAPLRASKGLIAGYCLLWDLGSEWLRGLRRILPIFRPIQMSKEPHAKQLNGKSETFVKGVLSFRLNQCISSWSGRISFCRQYIFLSFIPGSERMAIYIAPLHCHGECVSSSHKHKTLKK